VRVNAGTQASSSFRWVEVTHSDENCCAGLYNSTFDSVPLTERLCSVFLQKRLYLRY